MGVDDIAKKAAEDYAQWISPADAIRLLAPFDNRAAIEIIYKRLCHGLIRSMARTTTYKRKKTEYERIEQDVWGRASEGLYHNQVWYGVGDLEVDFGRGFEGSKFVMFGIRLAPDDLREIIPTSHVRPLEAAKAESAAVTTPPGKVKNPGGRPRKEFWDDLLIAIFQRIYSGDFKPTKQAELEAAMLDWAAQKGHELSESSVKGPAKKLLKALKD